MKSKPYVVVINGGMQDEEVLSSHRTYEEALAVLENPPPFVDPSTLDIMWRTSDGALTAEF